MSATLFPGGSEAVFAALALNHNHDPWMLLGIATLGNTLGGMSTWVLGRLFARRYPLDRPHQVKHRHAIEWLKNWGSPLLLFSWLPFVGDPLCFAAGWLRVTTVPALFFIGAGKAARYAVILFLV